MEMSCRPSQGLDLTFTLISNRKNDWDGIKPMALFGVTMVEHDSVVIEGCEVEDPVFHFFTIYGTMSTDGTFTVL